MPSQDVQEFHSLLWKSRNIVAIAGAGLSAASGIPTFKDEGGLWKSHDAMSLATPQAFDANPGRVWQFYHYRREEALRAKPNAAHFALASLSIPEHLQVIAPHATFTVITQNKDGLCTAACQILASGCKPHIYEMHGRIFDTICTVCADRESNTASPICPALGGTEYTFDSDEEKDIPLDDLPRCQKCSGLLRPGVVWFEEVPYRLKEIGEIVDNADMALVVGTSSTVYPAAGYAYEIAEHGGVVAIFNTKRTDGDEDADFLFLGPCEETLPHVLFGPH